VTLGEDKCGFIYNVLLFLLKLHNMQKPLTFLRTYRNK